MSDNGQEENQSSKSENSHNDTSQHEEGEQEQEEPKPKKPETIKEFVDFLTNRVDELSAQFEIHKRMCL